MEKAEDEPGADAIRATLNIRRFSTVRRQGRSNTGESTATGGSVPLSSRSSRRNRKDGSFKSSSSEWTHRGSTIREVPAEEEERRSSIQFNPSAPVTHIYPLRRTSPERYGSDDYVESVELSSSRPSAPILGPEPSMPRQPTSKRGNIQKQFSFGPGRKRHTEEEMVGLVEAGQNEVSMSENDKGNISPPSEHSEESESETVEYGRSGVTDKSYNRY